MDRVSDETMICASKSASQSASLSASKSGSLSGSKSGSKGGSKRSSHRKLWGSEHNFDWVGSGRAGSVRAEARRGGALWEAQGKGFNGEWGCVLLKILINTLRSSQGGPLCAPPVGGWHGWLAVFPAQARVRPSWLAAVGGLAHSMAGGGCASQEVFAIFCCRYVFLTLRLISFA